MLNLTKAPPMLPSMASSQPLSTLYRTPGTLYRHHSPTEAKPRFSALYSSLYSSFNGYINGYPTANLQLKL